MQGPGVHCLKIEATHQIHIFISAFCWIGKHIWQKHCLYLINTYWPSIINYQLLPTHYTASSSRNAQLSQLDLVIYDLSDHLNVQLVQNVVCIKPQPVFRRIQWKRVFEKLEGVYVANVVRQDVTTSKLQFENV